MAGFEVPGDSGGERRGAAAVSETDAPQRDFAGRSRERWRKSQAASPRRYPAARAAVGCCVCACLGVGVWVLGKDVAAKCAKSAKGGALVIASAARPFPGAILRRGRAACGL